MIRRDIIKDQIEQLGKVLAKILADFLKLKFDGDLSQSIEISNHRLQEELDIDVGKLVSLSQDNLKHYLTDRKLIPDHLEVLSDYLLEVGKAKMHDNPQEANLYFKKAISLLDLADEISKTISLTRMERKEDIRTKYKI